MKMSKAVSVLEAGKGLALELGHPECVYSLHIVRGHYICSPANLASGKCD